VKNGVPYDVAFSLPPEDVEAYGIIFGEMEGGSFDWNRWDWEKRD
jgi:hypothetical protein